MASTFGPKAALHPCSTQFDSIHVSRHTWIPQYQQPSIDLAPIDGPRATISAGTYPNQQQTLAASSHLPFVHGHAEIHSPQYPFPTFAIGMNALPPTLSPMVSPIVSRPWPSQVFAPNDTAAPADVCMSPASSHSSVRASSTPPSFSDLDDADKEPYIQFHAAFVAYDKQKQEKLGPRVVPFPDESRQRLKELATDALFTLNIEDLSPFSPNGDEHSFNLPSVPPVSAATFAAALPEYPIVQEDTYPPQPAQQEVHTRIDVPMTICEYRQAPVSPLQPDPTFFRIPPTAQPAQHHASSPIFQAHDPESVQYSHHVSFMVNNPRNDVGFISSYPVVSQLPALPRRPFTAGAALSQSPPLATNAPHSLLPSPVDPCPPRPTTAPSSLPYEFKIPAAPVQEGLAPANFLPDFDLSSPPRAEIGLSAASHHSACTVGATVSPISRPTSPWPSQQPRNRKSYTTSAKAGAIKSEVVAGKKPRGRKKKEEKPEPEKGKKVNEDAAPRRPEIKAPKRPASAWQLFFQHWVKQHMGVPRKYDGEDADRMSVHHEAKLASDMYHDIPEDEKEAWEERAKEEKRKYDKALAAWERTLRPELIKAENQFRAHSRRHGYNGKKFSKTNMKNPNIPPKPLSAFFLYSKEIKDTPELTQRIFGSETEAKARAKLAAASWRAMTPAEKQIYLDKAAENKAVWDETRGVYEEMTKELPDGVEMPPFPTLQEAREWMQRRTARLSATVRTTAQVVHSQGGNQPIAAESAKPRSSPIKA
ncbi:hypothetical protein DACRYDRAFT_19543 [Dacryopinax primogenitus]|uniref:HMG box domain-containing protein n=1 Tax=Dacryopinax primogenitus (strain DJM 731) TaxID=1858805 RepID=M5GCQ3_DACPD|nr:uncharacterized protein DACRYDRAFT_19543 [Dacryopinax primogenitus]EJU06355.1 hypothetical protein DACRYDRAFT_19543 [Dacryopinax primogenitus]